MAESSLKLNSNKVQEACLGGRPVQIISGDQSGTSYECETELLEEIFTDEKVKNKPVAIISVAGQSRKGKSFMLTLLLQYLKKRTTGKEISWWKNKSASLTEGFTWRGGKDKCTEGIWIWSEPFFIQTPEYGEVAVFLMDTQGSFDAQSNVKDCSSIFALSTFISSVQAYNVMQQIQEDCLQQLQLIVQYGKAVQSKVSAAGTEGKAFQNLVFVVRDWPDPDIDYGFEGGEEVLKELFSSDQQNSDVKSVRNEIKTSFDKVQCFLMPWPGKNVARRVKNTADISVKDVDEEFMEHVDALAANLFSPDTLAAKKINGRVTTGEELIDYIVAYHNALKSDKLPEVYVGAKAMAKAAIIKPLEDCKIYFDKEMKKLYTEGPLLEPKAFEESHQRVKNEALDRFDKYPKLGDDKFIQERREFLSGTFDDLFKNHERNYEQCKEKDKNQSEILVHALVSDYMERMFELCKGKYIEENCLRTTHEELVKRIVKEVEEKYDDSSVINSLKNELEEVYENVEKHNSGNKDVYNHVVADAAVALNIVLAVGAGRAPVLPLRVEGAVVAAAPVAALASVGMYAVKNIVGAAKWVWNWVFGSE